MNQGGKYKHDSCIAVQKIKPKYDNYNRNLVSFILNRQLFSSSVNVFKLYGKSLRKNDWKFKLVELGIEIDLQKLLVLDIIFVNYAGFRFD